MSTERPNRLAEDKFVVQAARVRLRTGHAEVSAGLEQAALVQSAAIRREDHPMCAGDDRNCPDFELHHQKLLVD